MLKFEILLCCLFYYKKSEVSAGKIYINLFFLVFQKICSVYSFQDIVPTCSSLQITAATLLFLPKLNASSSKVSIPLCQILVVLHLNPFLCQYRGWITNPRVSIFQDDLAQITLPQVSDFCQKLSYKKPPHHNLTPLSTQYVGQIKSHCQLKTCVTT